MKLTTTDRVVQHGCTFYIAVYDDMLRLDDIHVEDHNSKEWRRPPCSGQMPQQAALYQQVPYCCLSCHLTVRTGHSGYGQCTLVNPAGCRQSDVPALQVPWVKEKHGDYMKMKDDVSEVMFPATS